MIIILTSADLDNVLASSLDADLKRVLTLRRDQLAGGDLTTVARFIVVQTGDYVADLEPDPTFNIGDGARYGGDDFTPGWEWAERHDGWHELTFIFDDSGFTHVLLIPDRLDIDRTLRALLDQHC